MVESWKTKLLRWRFNWYPAFRRTGARVLSISEDLLEARVWLPLNRATRNIHGTIYGGSMYAAIDPIHAVMIAANLGPDFHVWMKSATIDFQRPGRRDLFAHVRLRRSEIEEIRTALTREPKVDRAFALTLADASGEIAASFVLTVHVRRRQSHEAPMHGVVFP